VFKAIGLQAAAFIAPIALQEATHLRRAVAQALISSVLIAAHDAAHAPQTAAPAAHICQWSAKPRLIKSELVWQA
jgi:hypothetical protein